MSQDKVADSAEQLQRLGTTLMVSLENGLFLDQTGQGSLHKIKTLITATEAALAKKDPATADVCMIEIQALYAAEVPRPTHFTWRLTYVYGLPNLVGTTFSYGLICWLLAHYSAETSAVVERALMWGATGGFVQGLYSTVQNVFREQLRQAWISWAPIAPMIGAFLALFMIQVGLAGVDFLGIKSNISGPTAEYLQASIATFAGYRWSWAIAKIESLMK